MVSVRSERSEPRSRERRLPRLLVLTDRRQARRSLVETIAQAVAGGARAVVLREKDLPERERVALATRLGEILAPVRGLLIVAGNRTASAAAVHLAATEPMPGQGRPGIVGRSCHDVAELDAAAAEQVDYATVSPVFSTASKPGYGPALGRDGLSGLCRGVSLPVYALGGVTAANAGDCLSAGAAGVAVMGEVMRAGDPVLTVAGLLAALEETSAQLEETPARRDDMSARRQDTAVQPRGGSR